MKTVVSAHGTLPAAFGMSRAAFLRAAEFFAAMSRKRAGREPWREVAIHFVDDAASAGMNAEIMGHEGPTDVITQRYDPIPGEEPGLLGELFVNTDCALREGLRRARWSPARELLLYAAHGIDHLSGADDSTEREYRAMRRRELSWLSRLPAAQKPQT